MGKGGTGMTILSQERRNQITDICQSLVRLKAYSGEEKPVIDAVVEWMHKLGYDDITLDERGNAIGTLRGDDSGAALLFDSHVDTVVANPADWRYDPFGAALADGRIYGRGTNDMRGPLAACLAAAAYAKEDGVLRGTVSVSATVNEEVIEGFPISTVIDRVKPNLVVICEPSTLKLVTAGRGRAEVRVTTRGKSAHASSPQAGVNAMKQMAKLVVALEVMEAPTDPLLGRGIFEPTEIISTPYPSISVVPWGCSARYDRRTLIGEGEAEVLAPINEVIDRLAAADPTFKAEAALEYGEFITYTGAKIEAKKLFPAWTMDRRGQWVTKAQALLQGAGQAGELGHYSFCTNGALSAGYLNIPTLGYGPGYEEVAHIDDEYIDLEQLWGGAEGYYALASLGG
jgi:putative selenium metabolism hydrolase